MKFFIVFSLALVAGIQCVPSMVNTGQSAVSRSDDGHGNYAFGYNEDHATGGSFRKENGRPGYQAGSYGLRDADGRMRVVSYVADAHGFRATISTNEPGVDPKQDPAAISQDYASHTPAAPPAHFGAPAPLVAKSYAAPAPIVKSFASNAAAHLAAATPIVAKSYAEAHAAAVVPVSTSSFQIATKHLSTPYAPPPPVHLAAPAPTHLAAPAPVLTKSYSAPAPAHLAVSAPVVAKTYSAPTSTHLAVAAPVVEKSYIAPAPAHLHTAAAPVVAKSYAAPVAAYSPALASAPAHLAPAAAAAPATTHLATPIAISAPLLSKTLGLAGLTATYSIHTLGKSY